MQICRLNQRGISVLLIFFLMGSMILQVFSRPLEAASDPAITVVLNGSALNLDPPARIQGGRTLVPLRMLMEHLGAQVVWDNGNRSILVSREGGASVTLWVDNRLIAYADASGKAYDVCDVPPEIHQDRTYVPLRLVANALGLNVQWDSVTRTVFINEGDAQRTPFYDLRIKGVEGPVSGPVELVLESGQGLPDEAVMIRYRITDPVTGLGKTIAQGTGLQNKVTWRPDPGQRANQILTASLYDREGHFLAGTAREVLVEFQPQIQLLGIGTDQTITGALELSNQANFAAASVAYEFKRLESGTTTKSEELDPLAPYTFNPTTSYNGAMEIRALAQDRLGQTYASSPVRVVINVPPAPLQLTLNSFSKDNVGKVPVTLSVSRNFDVSKTQYWARSVQSGQEVLLVEKPYGDHSWFPGPEMAGDWEVFARAQTPAGYIFTSNSQRVSIPSKPGIILQGVGPNQVITAPVKMNALANVPMSSIEFVVKNPSNLSQKTFATLQDASQSIAWTPEKVNEGNRLLFVQGTTQAGERVVSEPISVKVYLGQIFSARPVVAKDKFIDFVAPMALRTQKLTGMSASLQIAQAILETGWGQSVPVDKYSGLFSNNLFGVKGSASAGSVISNTWEEYYGTVYRIDAQFRAYHSVQESWDDKNALLLTRERYIPYKEVMFDSTWGAYALRRCGYATDSQYPHKLIRIIQENNLQRFDLQGL